MKCWPKLTTALAFLTALCSPAAAVETIAYPMPWNDVAPRHCALVVDEGYVVVRCKGHVDVTTQIPADYFSQVRPKVRFVGVRQRVLIRVTD